MYMLSETIIDARSVVVGNKTISNDQPADCGQRTTVLHIKSQLHRFAEMAERNDLEFLDSALRIAMLECDGLLVESIDEALHDCGNAFSNSIAYRQDSGC